MNISEIAILFSSIENTPKRLEMQALLTAFYAQCSAEEAAIVSYLLIGRIVPEFIPVEFQLSDKSLFAVTEKLSRCECTEALAELGDIGSVWEKFATHSPREMSVAQYYEALWGIALVKGTGSQAKKQELVGGLLQDVSPLAGKYTLRILNGKLRLGASERTILEALGKMGNGNIEELKRLYGNTSDIGHTAFLFKKYGEEAYAKASFSPSIPVSAKLVEREDSIEAIFKRIPAPLEEPKYDGLRIQLHIFKDDLLSTVYAERVWEKGFISSQLGTKERGEQPMTLFGTEPQEKAADEYRVMLFSRNLEDMSGMFPEVAEAARKIPAQWEASFGEQLTSLVLDGEVIGYNDVVQEYLPFQQTMTRKRKHKIDSAATEVPVKVFTFDLLLKDGISLMEKPLSERKKLLSFLDNHQEIQQTIVKTPIHRPETVEEAEKIFLEYVAEGLEGVIFKDEQSIYTPGIRNLEWLKYKKAMKKDLADTVDIVLLGYYRGEGKLAQFGIGALLAGVYEPNSDTFVTVTKIGTGITHAQWQSIKVACDAVKTDRQSDAIHIPKSLKPDVYLLPELVVEVEADEITKSPLHSSGYALRFPRFKRFREKKAEDTTSVQELAKMAGK